MSAIVYRLGGKKPIDNTNDLLEQLKRGAILFDRGRGDFIIRTAKRNVPVNRNIARYVIRSKMVVESGEACRYLYNTERNK